MVCTMEVISLSAMRRTQLLKQADLWPLFRELLRTRLSRYRVMVCPAKDSPSSSVELLLLNLHLQCTLHPLKKLRLLTGDVMQLRWVCIEVKKLIPRMKTGIYIRPPGNLFRAAVRLDILITILMHIGEYILNSLKNNSLPAVRIISHQRGPVVFTVCRILLTERLTMPGGK